ncbi:hypothetical protein [Acidovorax delafieldii]|uniref:hypothetical protein n=1 Tax=Acidovorax delafieldii TaxID=47920 RepID=UPI0012FD2C87|nr:hypothetical protein [Acidovorax delafieldii]
MASPDGVESIRIETASARGACSPSAHLHLNHARAASGVDPDSGSYAMAVLMNKEVAAIKK